MLIDWFTVVAQALNFLVLVWLLKRFLYHPILNAIDAREKRIASELADADLKKSEAQKEHDEFQSKNKAFDEQRGALLSKANDEAKAEGQRLVDEARKAADALSERRQEALIAETHDLNQAICRRTQDEVFAIARKALADLSTASLEERLAEVFVRRLGEMDNNTKKTLTAALTASSDPAVVRSAFDLPAEQQATIKKALNDTFATTIGLRFDTAPEQIAGIEFTAGGQKVGWTIASYLASLRKESDEDLNQQTKFAATPQTKTVAIPVAKSS
ncbi:F0F1 ATP synthase subunit delta [Rhodanobacter sp. MP7CTX1]|uniref:F0F1 ATP synthase subunit delta n=1 Tax=Rhodanobacter sp. MP7CTX1 TaxID=2723084 RepID=UPI00161FCA7B|nr:F0F1 ATP synthase subunit delta [Rhodanobacter sp. MP7CTX1]MBB6185981.1 F-type H+-transporting ATPase subunit b [Rhodanobacter sp. MP7CTX1]